MRKKVLILIFMISIIFLNSAFSKDLSIDDAVNHALNNSSSILQKTLDLKSAQIDEDGKYSSLYPSIQATTVLQRSNQGYTNPMTGVTADPTFTFVGSLSASFSFNPAMITSLQTTALQLKDKSISLQKAKKDLAVQIKKLYYGILLQEAALSFQQDNLDNLNYTLENTRKAYEDGNVPQLSVLQLQTQIASISTELDKSKDAIETQKRTLAFLIGEDNVLEPLSLVDKLPLDYNDDLSKYTLNSAIKSSYDLLSNSINKEIMDVQIKSLKDSMYFPSISLSLSYAPTIVDITNTWSGTNYSDNGKISASLFFDLSKLLPNSSMNNNLKKLDNTQDQLMSVDDTLRKNIIISFTNSMESIKHAKKQIQLSKDNIELAKKTYSLTSLSYENGDISFSDLKSAQLSLSNANLSLLQAEYEYLSAYLDLQNQCTQ